MKNFNIVRSIQLPKKLSLAVVAIMVTVGALLSFGLIGKLAAGDNYTVSRDASGIIDILSATNDNTSETFPAYCLDPSIDFNPEYPEYISTGQSAAPQILQLLARAYPNLSAKQLGIMYFNDSTLTDREAYEATQVAIWDIVSGGSYQANSDFSGKSFTLADALVNSPIALNNNWVSIDASTATAATNGVRDIYGPLNISVNTGNTNLDAAIASQGFALTPTVPNRNPAFTISKSDSFDGVAASTISVGTYYLNYAHNAGIDTTLTLSSELSMNNALNDVEVIDSVMGSTFNQRVGVVKTTPPVNSAQLAITPEDTTDPGQPPTEPDEMTLQIKKTWSSDFNGTEHTDGDPNGTFRFLLYDTTATSADWSNWTNPPVEITVQYSNGQAVVSSTTELKKNNNYLMIELAPFEGNGGDIMPIFEPYITGVTNVQKDRFGYHPGGMAPGLVASCNRDSGMAYWCSNNPSYAGVTFTTGSTNTTPTVSVENKKFEPIDVVVTKTWGCDIDGSEDPSGIWPGYYNIMIYERDLSSYSAFNKITGVQPPVGYSSPGHLYNPGGKLKPGDTFLVLEQIPIHGLPQNGDIIGDFGDGFSGIYESMGGYDRTDRAWKVDMNYVLAHPTNMYFYGREYTVPETGGEVNVNIFNGKVDNTIKKVRIDKSFQAIQLAPDQYYSRTPQPEDIFGSSPVNLYLYEKQGNGSYDKLPGAQGGPYPISIASGGTINVTLDSDKTYLIVEDQSFFGYDSYGYNAGPWDRYSGISANTQRVGYTYSSPTLANTIYPDIYSQQSIYNNNGFPNYYGNLNGTYPAVEFTTGNDWQLSPSCAAATQQVSIVNEGYFSLDRGRTMAQMKKVTQGALPGGWANDFRVNYASATNGSSVKRGSSQVASNGDYVELFADNNHILGNNIAGFVNLWEDPADFYNGSIITQDVMTGINGVTKDVAVNYETAWSSAGSTINSESVTGFWQICYMTYDPLDPSVFYNNVAYGVGSMGELSHSDCLRQKPSTGYYVPIVTIDSTYILRTDAYDSSFKFTATNSYSEVNSYTTPQDSGLALIKKQGTDGQTTTAQYLDGTKFKIYNATNDSQVDLNSDSVIDDSDIWELSSANRGQLGTIDGTVNYYNTPVLPTDSSYYLAEIEAVADYVLDDSSRWYFDVTQLDDTATSDIHIAGLIKSSLDVAGNEVNTAVGAVMNEKSFGLALHKFGRKNLVYHLAGAEFELWYGPNQDAFGNDYTDYGAGYNPPYGNPNLHGYKLVGTLTTADVATIIENLPHGWYKLIEINSPDGYILPGDPATTAGIDIHIGPLPNNPDENPKNVYVVNDKVAQTYGYLEINKVDDEGAPVGGVYFELQDEDGNLLMDIVTNENGYWKSPPLVVGDYILVEKSAPSGYIIDATDINVNVSKNVTNTARIVNERETEGSNTPGGSDNPGSSSQNIPNVPNTGGGFIDVLRTSGGQLVVIFIIAFVMVAAIYRLYFRKVVRVVRYTYEY